MQVVIDIGYETFVADVSGAELEVFNRILNKSQRCEDYYNSEKGIQLKEKVRVNANIRLTNAEVFPFVEKESEE
jgi:hypothetical protein